MILSTAVAITMLALTITGDPPTTYEDGTPLDQKDIQEYRVYEHRGNGLVRIGVDPGPELYTEVDIPPGSCFSVTAVAHNLESKLSETLCNDNPHRPAAPRLTIVQCKEGILYGHGVSGLFVYTDDNRVVITCNQ